VVFLHHVGGRGPSSAATRTRNTAHGKPSTYPWPTLPSGGGSPPPLSTGECRMPPSTPGAIVAAHFGATLAAPQYSDHHPGAPLSLGSAGSHRPGPGAGEGHRRLPGGGPRAGRQPPPPSTSASSRPPMPTPRSWAQGRRGGGCASEGAGRPRMRRPVGSDFPGAVSLMALVWPGHHHSVRDSTDHAVGPNPGT
jgi:hypothetical protein